MSAAAPARLLISPAIRTLIGRRLAELGGLALGAGGGGAPGGAGLLQSARSLASTPPPPARRPIWPGRQGAMAADLLLQSFGIAAVLPGFVALAWAWRIASHRGIGSFAARLASTLAALAGAGRPGRHPSLARCRGRPRRGLGGAIGHVLAASIGVRLCAGGARAVRRRGLATAGSARRSACPAGLGGTRAFGRRVAGGRAGQPVARCVQGRRAVGLLPRLAAPLRLFRRAPALRPAAGRVAHDGAGAQPVPPVTDRRPAPAAGDHSGGNAVATSSRWPPFRPPGRSISLSSRKAPPAHQPSLPLARGDAGPVAHAADLALLKAAPVRSHSGPSEESLQANARLLESVLDEYGVQGVDPRHPPRPRRHLVRAGTGPRHPLRPGDRAWRTTWHGPCPSPRCGSPPCQAAT